MRKMMDVGYYNFSTFEHILVINNIPIYLLQHIENINKATMYLNINRKLTIDDVTEFISDKELKNVILKVVIDEKKIRFNYWDNPFVSEYYDLGFKLAISMVKRNETSMFTYIKSTNCGDNFFEYSGAVKRGYNEIVFTNLKNEITECATSNIFFIKDNVIFTPSLECGLYNGVVRQYILKSYDVKKCKICIQDLCKFDEAFVANSSFGIMPVNQINDIVYKSFENGNRIREDYEKILEKMVTSIRR